MIGGFHLPYLLLEAPGYLGMGVGKSLSQRKYSLFRGAKITHACMHAAWRAERDGSSVEVGHSSLDLGNQLHLKKCPQRLEGLRSKSLGRKWWELCWEDGSSLPRSLPCLQAIEGGSRALGA